MTWIDILLEILGLGGGAPVREPPFNPTEYPPQPILEP